MGRAAEGAAGEEADDDDALPAGPPAAAVAMERAPSIVGELERRLGNAVRIGARSNWAAIGRRGREEVDAQEEEEEEEDDEQSTRAPGQSSSALARRSMNRGSRGCLVYTTELERNRRLE
jgi:hypothetical protein